MRVEPDEDEVAVEFRSDEYPDPTPDGKYEDIVLAWIGVVLLVVFVIMRGC